MAKIALIAAAAAVGIGVSILTGGLADMVGEWPTELKPKFAYVTDFLVTGVAILHRTKAGFSQTHVRILPAVLKRQCAESGCPYSMNGEAQGFCPEHQPTP